MRGSVRSTAVVLVALAVAPIAPLDAQQITGTINKLTYKLGPSQLSAAEQKAKSEAIAKVTD